MKGHMKRNMKHAGKLSEGRKATRGQLSQGVPKAGFPFIFNQHSCHPLNYYIRRRHINEGGAQQ